MACVLQSRNIMSCLFQSRKMPCLFQSRNIMSCTFLSQNTACMFQSRNIMSCIFYTVMDYVMYVLVTELYVLYILSSHGLRHVCSSHGIVCHVQYIQPWIKSCMFQSRNSMTCIFYPVMDYVMYVLVTENFMYVLPSHEICHVCLEDIFEAIFEAIGNTYYYRGVFCAHVYLTSCLLAKYMFIQAISKFLFLF